MEALTIEAWVQQSIRIKSRPHSPRGRALYTIDWFLNGKPVVKRHDNPKMTLAMLCPVSSEQIQ